MAFVMDVQVHNTIIANITCDQKRLQQGSLGAQCGTCGNLSQAMNLIVFEI